uniref:Uncharacterized protein n=1 Tax=Micrurus lemniscatus lemniscatus TaxID=129467 RepID=A0A2D4HF45_MICLE
MQACRSICTSSRHTHPPLVKMEHMRLLATSSSGSVRARSSTPSVAQFQAAQGPVLGCGPGIGPPAFKEDGKTTRKTCKNRPTQRRLLIYETHEFYELVVLEEGNFRTIL